MNYPSSVGDRTTEQVGFFRVPTVDFAAWLRDGLSGCSEQAAVGWVGLVDAIQWLAPAKVLSRYACIPMGTWTMLLNNGPMGTDVGLLPSYAARELKCRAIKAVYLADDTAFPARILEVYGPDGLPPLALERSVVAANDGGRWVFETSGTPFDFEDLEAYAAPRRSSRFSVEMLNTYLQALGVPIDVEPEWPGALLLERRSV